MSLAEANGNTLPLLPSNGTIVTEIAWFTLPGTTSPTVYPMKRWPQSLPRHWGHSRLVFEAQDSSTLFEAGKLRGSAAGGLASQDEIWREFRVNRGAYSRCD